MTLRRKAVIAVLVGSTALELALIPLAHFFPENAITQGVAVVLNLPGALVAIAYMIFAEPLLPAGADKSGTFFFVGTAVVSVLTWTGLAAHLFRQDKSDALTAWYEAVAIRRLTLIALLVCLASGVWLGVELASDRDANAALLVFALAILFVWFARRRE